MFVPLITPPELLYSAKGTAILGLHLLMMVNLLPVAGQYNPVWWTIPVESTFYLILPFAVYLFSGKRLLLGLLLTGVISLGWNLLCFNPPALLLEPLLWFHRACLEGVVPLSVIRNSWGGVLVNQLPTYAFVFGLGIFLANLQVRKQLGLAQGRFWKSVVSAMFGATYFVTGWATSIVGNGSMWPPHLEGGVR